MAPFLLAASAVIHRLTIVLLDSLSENSYNSNVEIAISRSHRLIISKAMINALRFHLEDCAVDVKVLDLLGENFTR
ncbi:hypothetical protein [Rhizobium leguminosarum]|uniref:hypothetical protein n=1 Tax=Rhizobium leguminosarum TaxID=384 RepID=UPI001C94EFE5|nr:hypothetical protein [Rhizobium leguminosarum]